MVKFSKFVNEATTEVNPSGEQHSMLPTMDAVEKKIKTVYKKSKVFETLKKAGYEPKLVSIETKDNMQYHTSGEFVNNRYGTAKLEIIENGVTMFITYDVYGSVYAGKKTTTWIEYISIVVTPKKAGSGSYEISNNIKKLIDINSPALVKNVKACTALFKEGNEEGILLKTKMPGYITLSPGSTKSVSNGGWPDSYSS